MLETALTSEISEEALVLCECVMCCRGEHSGECVNCGGAGDVDDDDGEPTQPCDYCGGEGTCHPKRTGKIMSRETIEVALLAVREQLRAMHRVLHSIEAAARENDCADLRNDARQLRDIAWSGFEVADRSILMQSEARKVIQGVA